MIVSILYLILITGILIDLFVIERLRDKYNRKRAEKDVVERIENERLDFPKRMRILEHLQRKMLRDSKKPYLWSNLIKR